MLTGLVKKNGATPILALILSSIVFYAFSSITNLLLLLLSITINYHLARFQISLSEQQKLKKLTILITAICYNMVVLIYFKYTLLDVNPLTISRDFDTFNEVILPLGISFYTFQQISFQIDSYWNKVTILNIRSYSLFVLFFPQLVAGPIVHHSEIIPQYKTLEEEGFRFKYWKAAVALFIIGLFKKTVIADHIGLSVDSVYQNIPTSEYIPFWDAWAAVIGFPLQIYFDFSGYSDMACALALLIGLRLPLNFNSPFKQTSLVDFWATWHMTLMRFFKDYIFTPISFSLARKVARKRAGRTTTFMLTLGFPIIVSFLLTGLWHGSGLTFILFGVIHGLAVSMNHGWRYFRLPKINKHIGWVATMLFVCITFVFLRAPNMAALEIYLSSLLFGDILLPSVAASFVPDVINTSFGQGTFMFFEWGIIMCLFIFIVIVGCLLLPNSNQLLWSDNTICNQEQLQTGRFELKFNFVWGLILGLMFALSALSLGYQTSDFIYFQF